MTTFVLVHGGFHGGWCWKRLVPLLHAAGHDVYTPTLTGLGERAHLAHPSIDLETHIQDILNVFEYEDLASWGATLDAELRDKEFIKSIDETRPDDPAELVDQSLYVEIPF